MFGYNHPSHIYEHTSEHTGHYWTVELVMLMVCKSLLERVHCTSAAKVATVASCFQAAAEGLGSQYAGWIADRVQLPRKGQINMTWITV